MYLQYQQLGQSAPSSVTPWPLNLLYHSCHCLLAHQQQTLHTAALTAVQRRRTAEDELNMREVYTEGDLISVSFIMLYSTCRCLKDYTLAALRSEKKCNHVE